jgi:hypothetical protein
MTTTRQRWFRLAASLAGMLILFGLVLPHLTRSVPILRHMAENLEENGIDPSRYYYTDVEQVQEGERYLSRVLGEQ